MKGFILATPIQLNSNGSLRHLLTLNGLEKNHLLSIFEKARHFLSAPQDKWSTLNGSSVFNLFFENSTRTRTTFEIAAKRLSADVINLAIAQSSTNKGETVLDTIDNLAAMGADIFVVRHEQNDTPKIIAEHLAKSRHFADKAIHVINAGDGRNAHPTQGLLDTYTIAHYKQDFTRLSVAIMGDILHSRVARSDIDALTTLGVPDIRVIAPPSLLPDRIENPRVSVYQTPEQGLKDVDVVITLRLQKERMESALIPSVDAYFEQFGLTPERLKLAKPDAIVMHPGPMNRGIEIESSVADGAQSVILDQVRFGIAVRMAVMQLLVENR